MFLWAILYCLFVAVTFPYHSNPFPPKTYNFFVRFIKQMPTTIAFTNFLTSFNFLVMIKLCFWLGRFWSRVSAKRNELLVMEFYQPFQRCWLCWRNWRIYALFSCLNFLTNTTLNSGKHYPSKLRTVHHCSSLRIKSKLGTVIDVNVRFAQDLLPIYF